MRRLRLRWLLPALFAANFGLAFVPGWPAHGFGHVWFALPLVFWFRHPAQRPRLALYAAALALQLLAYPDPDLGFLGWVLLWPYLVAREREDGASRWRAAFLFGFLRAHAGFYWLGNIHFAAWWAVSVGSGFVFACVFEMIMIHARFIPRALRSALAWVAFEWAHAWFLGGLPWLFLAHTQYRYPVLIRSADLVGAYGLSFLMAFCQAAALEAVRSRRWRPAAAVAAVLFATNLGYGLTRDVPPGAAEGPRVLLVQTALPHSVKYSGRVTAGELLDTLERLTRDGLRANPDTRLVVWPETMFPYPYVENLPLSRQHFGRETARLARVYRRPFVLGVNTYSDLGRVEAHRGHNSVVLVDAAGAVRGLYRKRVLVPMGEEFLPRRVLPAAWADTLFDWLVSVFDYPINCDLEKGEEFATLDAGPGLRGAVLICFEGLYAHLAREALQRGGGDFVLHLVNNGWFGASWEQRQSVASWVFRAVETGTPFLSCANGGITCAIAPDGRILGLVDRVMGEGRLAVRVPPRRDETIYLAWGWAALPAALALAVAICGLAALRRRRAGAA